MKTSIECEIAEVFGRMSRTARTKAEIDARFQAESRALGQKVDTSLLTSGFPSRCVATVDFREDRWLRALRFLTDEVMKPGASTWLLIGTRGGGKTTMATCAARAVVTAGGRARFAYLPEVLDAMRESATATIKRLGIVRLLVIDDVATECKLTTWQRDALTTLIRRRHDNELPTVMTANGTKAATVQRQGATIASRLAQGGIISADWPSFRHTSQDARSTE